MTERELMAISLESGVSLATVRKWKHGQDVDEHKRNAIVAAAKKLRVKVPQ